MTPARYAPARWLPGAHTMTVFASVARPFPRPRSRRERWELPDGDFLDVDRVEPGAAGADRPVLVVLHGLEGSSRAPYVRGLVALALAEGLSTLAVNFRGCSGEPNRLARNYHSGETGDLASCVGRLAAEAPGRPILLAGFSLGGNVVAKWLGDSGDALPPEVRGGAVISVPVRSRAVRPRHGRAGVLELRLPGAVPAPPPPEGGGEGAAVPRGLRRGARGARPHLRRVRRGR